MSDLLQNWLNNEVGLSTNVSNFEKDFASGYLFGEILHKFRQQDDFRDFVNKNSHEAKLSNFRRLEPTFKALGIKFNASQSNAMMNGERGASLRLLYQLKMAAERLMLAGNSSMPESQTAAVPSNVGGAVTKAIRVPREQFDSHDQRFFEHRLRATGVNVKQARVDKLTKKFELEMQKQEYVAFEMDKIEEAHKEEQRQIHRFGLRERLRQNKVAKDEWTDHSIQLWEQNMKVRLDRDVADIRFNEKCLKKQKEKFILTREKATKEVNHGIKDFEGSLATLGSLTLEARTMKQRSDDDSSDDDDEEELRMDKLLARTTKAGTAKELVESIQARLPSAQELEQDAGMFMRKIKESRHAGSIARRERERRRRRVLVEQQREQDTLEESKLEEVLLEKLGRESIEEAAISYSVWRTRTYEDVIARNRQIRNKEYAACKKRDHQEALRRDQDLRNEMIESLRAQEVKEQVRYRALERNRHAARRAKLREEMEHMLELVSAIALASLEQEQLTDKEEVDPTLWREWMALFEANQPVSTLKGITACAEEQCPLTAVPDLDMFLPVDDEPGLALNAASIRDYVECKGQWEIVQPEKNSGDAEEAVGTHIVIYDPLAEAQKALEESKEISFIDKLSSDIDIVDGRPVNYRLGVLVASMLDRCYKMPEQPPPPSMPEVPLRLVITGRPFTGKRTIAGRLAEAYNLKVVEVADVVRECLHLSKRPDLGNSDPVDVLSIAGDVADELCRRSLEEGNPYVKELQDIGYEMQRILDHGEVISDEMYVHAIVTKIRSLFPFPRSGDKKDLTDEANREMINVSPDSEGRSNDADETEALAATIRPEDIGGEDDDLANPFGWVLVGFPDDARRLALLERFLSGWVDPKATPTPQAELLKSEAALIAPRPPEDAPPVIRKPGGYDLHLRLEVPFEESVRRGGGRRVDPTTNLVYHIEDSPPPNEKVVIYERLVLADSLSKSMSTLTQRTHAFDVAQMNVDDLLEYFGPFPDVPRLVHVDARGSMDATFEAAEEQVAMLLERKRAERAATREQAAEDNVAVEEQASDKASADGDQAEDESKPPEASLEEKPFEPVEIMHLPKHLEKIEDEVFELLMEEWRDLQSDFEGAVQQLFAWHRSHLDDFRGGMYGMKQRFVEFLQRRDDRQALVDDFVQRFNAFSDEYPDMRKQDATKEELHKRADELHERLVNEVEHRCEEAVQQLEVMKQSRWTEMQTEVFAVQVQHAVQLEVRRYHNACQLLSDFYHSAMQLGLPEVKEAPPKVDAFSEDKADEAPVDAKGKKAPEKAKGKKAEEVIEPDTSPEEKAALRLCKWVPPSDAEGEGRWDFPFVQDILQQAKGAVWRLQDFVPPKVELPKTAEVVEPVAKAKAKGKPEKKKDAVDEAPPPPPMPLPPLFVDLQQALIAERATFGRRLAVLEAWAKRRLLEVATCSKTLFEDLKEWIVLRRQKELESAIALTGVIKDHIESEDFITAKLSFDGAHLHRRPNLLLKPPEVPIVPPAVEGSSSFRWSIEQLNGLLEAVSNAVSAVSLESRMISSGILINVLQQLCSASDGEKPLKVPASWSGCGVAKLRSLVGLFDHPVCSGSIDIVEFLLHIGLLHSPLGWPSMTVLIDVRKSLEPLAPPDTAWPDFYVTAEQLQETPLFADRDKAEANYAKKFKPGSDQEPEEFDRPTMQLSWVVRVLNRFMASHVQHQAWELEAAWFDYKVRRADEHDRYLELFDDLHTSPADTPRDPGDAIPNLLATDQDKDDDAASFGSSANSGLMPQEPRPDAPENLPIPPPGSISVRQLLAYLCEAQTPEDGINRSLAVLAPTGTANGDVQAAVAHSILLQLGARPTPPPAHGDSRPAYPSLQSFCEEIDHKHGGHSLTTDLVNKAELLAMLKTMDIGRRHKKAEVEKLFPKAK